MREAVRDALLWAKELLGNKSSKCDCMACNSIEWMEKTFDCASATDGPEFKKALNFVNKNVNGKDELIELLRFATKRIDEIHPQLASTAETYMKLYMIRDICLGKLKEEI